MAEVEKYVHHGVEVSVLSKVKGQHRENCLCWSGCKFFKPDTEDNCELAKELYVYDCKYNMTTPVFECAKFEKE